MVNFFGFGNLFSDSKSTEIDLKSPFCLKIKREHFANIKTEKLFEKILQRCYSRSEGAKDEKKIASLFDSSESSSSPRGLISMLAKAMTDKKEMAIIYDSGVIREADYQEKQQIKADYANKTQSSKGILVNFTRYCLTDLVREYMGMIYDVLVSMNTQVGLAKSLQIKVSNLRPTVSAAGKEEPIKQAQEINEALKSGNSVLLDKNDEVQVLTLNAEAVKNAITLINSQLASDLGMPLSFVNGELTTGMSATGEADANAEEYGLQDYFNSIFKPACDKLYNWDLQFISDDWRYFQAMIGSLIAVENSSLLSNEQKTIFAERLIPEATKKK